MAPKIPENSITLMFNYNLLHFTHPKGVVNLNKALGDNRNSEITAVVCLQKLLKDNNKSNGTMC